MSPKQDMEKRCIPGTAEDQKQAPVVVSKLSLRARNFLRTGLILVLFSFIICRFCWSVFPVQYHYTRTGHGSHQQEKPLLLQEQDPQQRRLLQQCHSPFIGWGSRIVAQGSNLELRFGKGYIQSRVVVTVGEVSQPTLYFSGQVSQNPDDHDDDEYNDYGIQMKVDKSKDASLIHMWADEQEDNQGESFCAFIEVGLVLPETVTEFGILTIAGNQMDIEIKAVENDEEVVDGGLGANAKIITFDRVNLSSFQGTILVEALVAKKVVAKVTYGSIQILDYTAPPGVAMDLSASLELGNVYLIALFPRLLSTTFYAAAQNHTLNLVTGEGNIFGHVQKQEHHGYGDLSVKMLSGRGNVKSNIQLDDKQLLFLDSATKQGQAECFISDSFLGLFRVEGGGGDPAYGTATVEEKSDSVSKIEYSKNEIALKAGRKFTLQDNRRENPRDQSGLLLVSSGKYGSSRVTFQ